MTVLCVLVSAVTFSASGLWMFAGYLLGRDITPDLDLIGITQEEARWIKTVVLIPLVMWSTLYARCMQALGGHRSFWSHSPVVGTFIRLCFFAAPMFVPVQMLLPGFGYPMANILAEFVWIGVGLSIADTIHFILDLL